MNNLFLLRVNLLACALQLSKNDCPGLVEQLSPESDVLDGCSPILLVRDTHIYNNIIYMSPAHHCCFTRTLVRRAHAYPVCNFDYVMIARMQPKTTHHRSHSGTVLALPQSKLSYHILDYYHPQHPWKPRKRMRIQYESPESTAQLLYAGSCGYWLEQRLVAVTLIVCTEKPELTTDTGNEKLDRVMIEECNHPLQTLVHIF